MLDALEIWAVGLVGSPWIFVVLVMFVVIDAFFPPIPSETLVIGLGALSVSAGSPPVWAIVLVTALAAVVGDSLAYAIGRRFHFQSWRPLRAARVQSVFGWADGALRDRPARLIVSARFIPVGRVAVNMTAGSLGFPPLKFVGLAGIAGTAWASYSTLIGVGAGVWLGENPLLAVVCGASGGLAIGYLVDVLLGRVLGHRQSPEPVAVLADEHPAAPIASATGPGNLAVASRVAQLRSSAAGPVGRRGPTPL